MIPPCIDRKSVVQGKSVDLGGRRIIKKKKNNIKKRDKNPISYPQIPGNKYADNYVHGKINVDEKECGDYIKTQHVVDFIKNHDHAKPFFININYSYTHPPYGIMEPYYSKFMKKNLKLLPDNPGKNKPEFMYKLYELHNTQEFSPEDRKEMLALYYGMLNYIDNRVKEIYTTLKEKNELEVVRFSYVDKNGDLQKDHKLSKNDLTTNLHLSFGCGIWEFKKK